MEIKAKKNRFRLAPCLLCAFLIVCLSAPAFAASIGEEVIVPTGEYLLSTAWLGDFEEHMDALNQYEPYTIVGLWVFSDNVMVFPVEGEPYDFSEVYIMTDSWLHFYFAGIDDEAISSVLVPSEPVISCAFYQGSDYYGAETFSGGTDFLAIAIPVSGDTPLDSILSVFQLVGSFLAGAFATLSPIYWTGESLTFLGVLAVAGLALSVVLLILGIIQRFMHFRG